jgi:acylphosphatase
MIRKTVHYSGHVQGVNFRATARRIARGSPVTGYVKNLPDGRVELVAEGEEKDVDAVLSEVAEAMSGFIRDTRVDTGAASGEFDSFGIAY